MRCAGWLVAAAALAALGGFSTAGYAGDADLTACQLGRRNPEASVPACSRFIDRTRDARQKANALYNRAIAYSQRGDLPRALDDLNRAIELGAHWSYVYEDRAEVKAGLKDFAGAIPDYDAAIRLDPGKAFRYNGRGWAYQQTGAIDAALSDFNTALSIDPRDFRFFNRGVLFMAKRAFAKAVPDFNETIRRNGKFAEAYAKRGLAFMSLGQMDRAQADTDKAVEIDPKDPSNFVDRATVLEQAGNLPKALADLDAASAIRPENAGTIIARDRLRTRIADATRVVPSPPPPSIDVPASALGQPSAKTPHTSLRRVALVIGNSLYGQVSRLANTADDARAVAQMFRREGFDAVELKADLGGAELRRALGDFELVAQGADIAIVYFAGHGIESAGRNYLVPVDARLEREVDIEDEAVPLDRVMRAVDGARRLRLVILDACRNDPFKASMQQTRATRSVDRGLARVEPRGDTLVAYSAAAGTVAQDGEAGHHSPFTQALLKDLAVPDLDVRLALGRVRDDVRDATNGQQEPYVAGSLGGAEVFLTTAR